MENFSDLNGNGSYEATYGHDDIIMAEVQQAALMQTLKYKLLQESFEGSLAVSSSGIEYVNYYDNGFGTPTMPDDQYFYNGDDLYMF